MNLSALPAKVWRYACRWNPTRQKRSTRNLHRLCRENATAERTLVVHSEDVPYEPYFPNVFTVTKRPASPADLHVDAHYRGLDQIADTSFPVILCTGLLEHIPDPGRLLEEFRRILQPGGRLILSASAVFSFHEGPDNYFHFTPHGLRLLLKDWSRIEMMRGASQPFETIGILLQRINMQCDIFPPARLLVELLFRLIPLLDGCIYAQYYNARDYESRLAEGDSMLPSNMQAVVIK